MHVAHFFKAAMPDWSGGIEQVIDRIATDTQALGIRTTVMALADNPPAEPVSYNGYTVRFLRRDIRVASMGLSLRVTPAWARLAREADVVHYHFPWPFMDLAHFAGRVRTPSLVTYHSDIVRQKRLLRIYRPLMHKFLGDMDHIVATSPNYLASSPVLARYRDKVSVVPIGTDRKKYPTPDNDTRARWRSALPDRFLLFVGFFRYYKGLDYLLRAAQGTGIPLVLVGDGPDAKALKARARALGLGDQVHFPGQLAERDKVALLQACTAFVFPSHLRSEAFGIALLEAAMFGRPMISAEIGTGTSYINLHEETGLVVPPADPDALRAAMRRLWDNPAEAEAMGQRAQERYQSHFTGARQAEGYARIYADLAAGRPVAPAG